MKTALLFLQKWFPNDVLTDKHRTWSTQISEISLNCKHVNLALPLVKIWKISIMGSWHGTFKDNDRAKWMVFLQFGQPCKERVVGLTCFNQLNVRDLLGLCRCSLATALLSHGYVELRAWTSVGQSFQLLTFYYT